MIPLTLTPTPLIAILRGVRPEEAEAIASVIAEAGFGAIEVPLNSPDPLASIEAIARKWGDRVCVGVGTVLSPDEVDPAARAGAKLVVAPNTDGAVIARAFNLGLASLPGVATPTEAVRALGLGASALKLFPAEAMPPEIVKAWRSVLPKAKQLFPVGGVTPERIAPYRRPAPTASASALRSTGRAPRPRRLRARRRLLSRLGARPDKVPSAPVALGRYRSGRPGSERKRNGSQRSVELAPRSGDEGLGRRNLVIFGVGTLDQRLRQLRPRRLPKLSRRCAGDRTRRRGESLVPAHGPNRGRARLDLSDRRRMHRDIRRCRGSRRLRQRQREWICEQQRLRHADRASWRGRAGAAQRGRRLHRRLASFPRRFLANARHSGDRGARSRRVVDPRLHAPGTGPHARRRRGQFLAVPVRTVADRVRGRPSVSGDSGLELVAARRSRRTTGPTAICGGRDDFSSGRLAFSAPCPSPPSHWRSGSIRQAIPISSGR